MEIVTCESCKNYEDGLCDIWLRPVDPDDRICQSFNLNEEEKEHDHH